MYFMTDRQKIVNIHLLIYVIAKMLMKINYIHNKLLNVSRKYVVTSLQEINFGCYLNIEESYQS